MAVDRERLTERLAAVERRLTDAEPEEGGLADAAAVEGRLSELEDRADDIDERLGEVESGLQALRGYLGGVEAVDESVERRADAALAKAEELEAMLVDEPGLRVERVSGGGERNRGGEQSRDGDRPRDERAGDDRRRTGAERSGARGESRATAALGDDRGRDREATDHEGGGNGGRGGHGGHDRDPEDGDRRLVDRIRDAL